MFMFQQNLRLLGVVSTDRAAERHVDHQDTTVNTPPGAINAENNLGSSKSLATMIRPALRTV